MIPSPFKQLLPLFRISVMDFQEEIRESGQPIDPLQNIYTIGGMALRASVQITPYHLLAQLFVYIFIVSVIGFCLSLIRCFCGKPDPAMFIWIIPSILCVIDVLAGDSDLPAVSIVRSEERRVGKECIYRWSPYH